MNMMFAGFNPCNTTEIGFAVAIYGGGLLCGLFLLVFYGRSLIWFWKSDAKKMPAGVPLTVFGEGAGLVLTIICAYILVFEPYTSILHTIQSCHLKGLI